MISNDEIEKLISELDEYRRQCLNQSEMPDKGIDFAYHRQGEAYAYKIVIDRLKNLIKK